MSEHSSRSSLCRWTRRRGSQLRLSFLQSFVVWGLGQWFLCEDWSLHSWGLRGFYEADGLFFFPTSWMSALQQCLQCQRGTLGKLYSRWSGKEGKRKLFLHFPSGAEVATCSVHGLSPVESILKDAADGPLPFHGRAGSLDASGAFLRLPSSLSCPGCFITAV